MPGWRRGDDPVTRRGQDWVSTHPAVREEQLVSVHVDEVETRVVPAAVGNEETSGPGGGRPKPEAETEAWAEQQHRVRRDRCRTLARDFDD